MIKLPFKKLQIWKKSVDLSLEIYSITRKFPKDELYGLTSQVRRSSVSVFSNIAEGSQHSTDKDFARFLLISKGSLAELGTQLIISQKLGYLDQLNLNSLNLKIQEIDKMCRAFYLKLIS